MVVKKTNSSAYNTLVSAVLAILQTPKVPFVQISYGNPLTGANEMVPRPEIIDFLETFNRLTDSSTKAASGSSIVGWNHSVASKLRTLASAVAEGMISKLVQTDTSTLQPNADGRMDKFIAELTKLDSDLSLGLGEETIKNAAVADLISQLVRSKQTVPTEYSVVIRTAWNALKSTTSGILNTAANTEFVHLVDVLCAEAGGKPENPLYRLKKACLGTSGAVITEAALDSLFRSVIDVWQVQEDGKLKQFKPADFPFSAYLSWTMSPVLKTPSGTTIVRQQGLDKMTEGRPIVFSIRTTPRTGLDPASHTATADAVFVIAKRLAYLESDINALYAGVDKMEKVISADSALASDRAFLRRAYEDYLAHLYVLYSDWRGRTGLMRSWLADVMNLDTPEKRRILCVLAVNAAAKNPAGASLQSVNRMVKRLEEYYEILSEVAWADILTTNTFGWLASTTLEVPSTMAVIMGGETVHDILDSEYWNPTSTCYIPKRLKHNSGDIDVILHFLKHPDVQWVISMIRSVFALENAKDALSSHPNLNLPLKWSQDRFTTNAKAADSIPMLFGKSPDYPSFRPFCEMNELNALAMLPYQGKSGPNIFRSKQDYSALTYYNWRNSIATANELATLYSVEATAFLVTAPLYTPAYYKADAFFGTNNRAFPFNVFYEPKDTYLFAQTDTAKILSRNTLKSTPVNMILDGVHATKQSYLLLSRTENGNPIALSSILPIEYSNFFGVSPTTTAAQLNSWLDEPFKKDKTQLTLPYCIGTNPVHWFIDKFVPRIHIDLTGQFDLEFLEEEDWHGGKNEYAPKIVFTDLTAKGKLSEMLRAFAWKVPTFSSVFVNEIANIDLLYTLGAWNLFPQGTAFYNEDYEPEIWLKRIDDARG